jgi:hypothetical protein
MTQRVSLGKSFAESYAATIEAVLAEDPDGGVAFLRRALATLDDLEAQGLSGPILRAAAEILRQRLARHEPA